MITDSIQSLTAGLTPARDKNQSISYVIKEFTNAELSAIYRTTLGGRVVDQRAEDTFRKWREWQSEGDQTTLIEKAEKALKLKGRMEEAQKLANLHGVAYVLINLADDAHGEPIDYSQLSAGCIRSLTVLGFNDISPGPDSMDIYSEYYNEPEYYHIMTGQDGGITTVHPDRLVKLYGVKRLELDTMGRRGDSVLMRGMSALNSLNATAANIASLVWEAKIDVMSIKGLADSVGGDPEEEAAVMRRLNAAMHAKGNNGALILDAEGEVYQQKTINFSTLPELLDAFQTMFCAAYQYPKSLIFEDDTAGLGNNGAAGLEKYYNSVSSDQENVIEPSMAFLDGCLIIHALGSNTDGIWYKWKPLWNMSDKEVSEIGLNVTKTFTEAVDKGIVSIEVANKAWVNRMTESGAAPGLEGLNNDYIGKNKLNPTGEVPQDVSEALED